MKPIIAITVGDFNGIGPEIALKATCNPSVKKICTPVLIGPFAIFTYIAKQLKVKTKIAKTTLPLINKKEISVIDVGDGIPADIQYGMPSKSAGRSAGAAIELAVELCSQKKIDAIVTAPASKETLNLAGYNFPGQTEMIALFSRSQRVAMILVSDKMRVGLVTIHTSIKNVADQISKDKIIEKLSIVNESLKMDFKIKKPRIAVLALNPHSGEHGLIGNEEEQIIKPAITDVINKDVYAEGPFSPDSFFGMHYYKKFDAIIAMYHDQGLIPFKMKSFGKGVNYSAGLNIIRTSPDHGTAFDIAGKNKADISSIIEAIKLAVKISSNRKNR